jgi:hypothetical protein
MRDASFYFQLGFEHGYASLDQSYPDNLPYAQGHEEGLKFRDKVLKLSPSIKEDSEGRLTVFFPYALHGVRIQR